jgi:high-affinity K+ transport system ATPase subunit B
MSGVDIGGRLDPQGRGRTRCWRRRRMHGAARAGRVARDRSSASAAAGGTPLAVADGGAAARRRPPQGHRQGRHRASASPSCAAWASSTVMITGDNPLTAAAIAAEAGRRRLPRRGDARGQAQR